MRERTPWRSKLRQFAVAMGLAHAAEQALDQSKASGQFAGADPKAAGKSARAAREQLVGRRRTLSGKVLPPGHVPAPSWHELVAPGPKPRKVPQSRPWNATTIVGTPRCAHSKCHELPGHDDGVHQVPVRRRRSFSYRPFVKRSPRMRHGVDDVPRRKRIERELIDPRVRRALRERKG